MPDEEKERTVEEDGSTNSAGPDPTSAEGAHVRIAWDLDPGAAEELSNCLQSVPVGPGVLTVDLREVEYLDSAAVSVLYQHVRRGLRILVRDGTATATVMRICGLASATEVQFLPA